MSRSVTAPLLFVVFVFLRPLGAVGSELSRPQLGLDWKGDDAEIRALEDGRYEFIHYDNGNLRTIVYEPPYLLNVTVTAHVKEVSGGTEVRYRYSVMNDENSRQTMTVFGVEFVGLLTGFSGLNNWVVLGQAGRSVVFWVGHEGKGLTGGQSEVFSFGLPRFSGARKLALGSGDGFAIVSAVNTLPGLVKCYARGEKMVLSMTETEARLFSEKLPRPMDEMLWGTTVGPVAVDGSRPIEELPEQLHSYLEASRALGWIRDRELDGRYEAQISRIKATLTGYSRDVPMGMLRGFLDAIVDDHKKGDLSEEAYALLWFNARYLYERL